MGALDCVANGKMQPTESTEVFSINLSSNTALYEPRRDVEAQGVREGSRRHSLWWAALVDFPLLLMLLAFAGLFEFGFLPDYKAGFYCNDPALSYPFNGDTVSSAMLVAGILTIPVVVILATELMFSDKDYWLSRLTEALRKSLPLLRNYFYGFIFNFTIMEVMKAITGSPRPTFFDICQPYTAKTCNGSEFVSTFTCTSTKFTAWEQRDSYHSFPSGHTSLSVHCGLFLAWYLQSRAFDWRHRTVLVVPVAQLLVLTFAVTSSLTRITDHRHHWWDVTVGFIIGVATTYYSAAVLCKRFASSRDETLPFNHSVKRLLYTNEPPTP